MTNRQTFAAPGLLACMLGLAACAETEPLAREPVVAPQNLAEELGCGEKEIAICISTTCGPDDFECTHQDDIRDMFEVQRRRR